MPCAFCTDLVSTGTLLLENAHTWTLLHPDWSPRGHVMVVSKQHVENASALPLEAWIHVARMWHCVERAVLAFTGAERAIMMKLGIQTPHLHLHVYPVPAAWDRDAVFEAIDGRRQEPHDDAFVSGLRQHLTLACR